MARGDDGKQFARSYREALDNESKHIEIRLSCSPRNKDCSGTDMMGKDKQ